MSAPFIHQLDPILGEVGGVYLWFYGLCYALGFVEIHVWLRRVRERLGFTMEDVNKLSLYFILGVLLGGRAVEVVFYEWPYYSQHLQQIPAYWLGGMATHGLMLGAVAGTWLFCRLYKKNFLQLADELVIPGALLMGLGRIGNFIDGQIVGGVTDVFWAVKFPDAEGFRHPVVLYDGLKNLLLIPFLLWVRQSNPRRGMVMAHFVFWYGFLRLFVDLFREYPTELLGIATGQSFNIFMSVLGACLLILFARAKRTEGNAAAMPVPSVSSNRSDLWIQRIALVGLICFSLTMPSDWTQDIPARYGKRHPGLHYSWLYPRIETTENSADGVAGDNAELAPSSFVPPREAMRLTEDLYLTTSLLAVSFR